MQVLSVENICFAICKTCKHNKVRGGGGDVRGIDGGSFTLRNQPRLLFFPPPFTTICFFVVLGMSVHWVFHRFLVGVKEDVLESKSSQYLFFLFSFLSFFLFFFEARGGLTFGTRYQVLGRIRI